MHCRVATRILLQAICAVLLWMPPAWQAQSMGGPLQRNQNSGSINPFSPNETDPQFLRSQQNLRLQARILQVRTDSQKLVTLCEQLKKNLDQHGTLTAEDKRLLLEIEKLSHTVKVRMRE